MSQQLKDLVSVGPATLQDFSVLGITSVKQLAKKEAHALFRRLCRLTGHEHDPCVEDVFAAAIAQAQDPHLPEEQKQWPYWSRLRKQRPQRCAWVPVGNTLYEHYHDAEWGVPVHDDRRHFEFLILEGAQAGLSWETILKRRDGYAEAFAHFDWHKVAAYTPDKIQNLMHNPAIIRNRAKIEAAVINARCFDNICKEFGSFDAYVWRFVSGKPLQPRIKSLKQLPTSTPEAKALSRDLIQRGFKFVGPTIIYAYMQAIGMTNDHTTSCFRWEQCSLFS